MTEKEYDKLIKEAGMIAIEKMYQEDLKYSNDKPPFELSKKFEKQMKKLIKNI